MVKKTYVIGEYVSGWQLDEVIRQLFGSRKRQREFSAALRMVTGTQAAALRLGQLPCDRQP